MHWIYVILIGFVAGFVAKFVTGDRKLGGFIVTTVLGMIGAVFATWLGQKVGWYAPGEGAGFMGAVVGAVIILAVYHAITDRRSG
jgi:uncharacterized membrane protein YeaQ/YmgE (transglycosylase-associated protein family)